MFWKLAADSRITPLRPGQRPVGSPPGDNQRQPADRAGRHGTRRRRGPPPDSPQLELGLE